MKTKLVGLLAVGALGLTALAADLKEVSIPSSRETPQSLVVLSDNQPAAQIKLIKSGSIKIHGQEISSAMRPGGKITYNIRGGSSVEIIADGKSIVKVSGESMIIESQKAN